METGTVQDRILVETCAPTLAGLKTASLINVPYESKESANRDVRRMNRMFSAKGARVIPLRYRKERMLLYVYRPLLLKRDMENGRAMAKPSVADVVAFGNEDPDEMLRLAACLEEHYPHSMANAVVEEAKRRGLDHAEKHTRVEYVVAHGIASSIDGKRVIIGSRHFVFEDEGVNIPEGFASRFEALLDTCSHLYLAIGGMLSAVILIDDPVREEAAGILPNATGALLHNASTVGIALSSMTGLLPDGFKDPV